MAPSQKINLKDKVEDGEIDLSMCDLQDVPVKEIANIKNIYSLDLSNNHLTTLPKNFATLTYVTKLDLSKNTLTELPDNFGDLIKLKHLDLYKNGLSHLPLSFSKLKALKWLDLKDNPLLPAIKDMAGPCLDTKQCLTCAKNIVQFYTDFQQKVETERDAREKQRQKDKLANDLVAQKLKLQEKKNKKKEKIKQKLNGGTLEEEVPIVNVNSTHILEEAGKINKEKNVPIPWLLTKFLSKLMLIMVLTLFISTSVNLKYTEFVRQMVEEVWKGCIDNVPPSLQLLGNNFAVYFKNFHFSVGEGLISLTTYFREFLAK